MKEMFNRALAWVWLKLCFWSHPAKPAPYDSKGDLDKVVPADLYTQIGRAALERVAHTQGALIRMHPYQPVIPDSGVESPRAAEEKPQASMSAKKRARLKKQEKNRRKRSK